MANQTRATNIIYTVFILINQFFFVSFVFRFCSNVNCQFVQWFHYYYYHYKGHNNECSVANISGYELYL